ncbi:chemotaxis-specific protein-glutamate methyltransferase CheB [Natronolimnohabitans innermongolicus]|uniref:Protein-glutamate methylesterase/protein-glutamine glutaminase n=1 Tax=Natronolimnohabitans innermongolicus JCM 12255 TaxID=1227499 RepID=L9WIZ4_9EURY|nr:chemotaxis-specific protein-glutamate methyltransferase CheB [Natronolimnohabitans innermongolicus]ELY49196.1 chemotaxis-specific methylesterase [Natronolimnohabitans innermongolicus JCM 12255]
MVRAVIADDSGVMRKILEEMLEDAGIEVVATAHNGHSAVEAILEHEPDVATVDIDMPGLDGLEVIDRVLAERPTPILVISAQTGDRADVTFEALDRGAVDFIPKPSGRAAVDIWARTDEIVDTVRATAAVDPATLSGVDADASPSAGDNRVSAAKTGPSASTQTQLESISAQPTLVIGASTGGPQVVERVLAELPQRAALRILVVQHMVAEYTSRFAKRLNAKTAYDVREATDGETIDAGEAVVAKGGYHLRVTAFRNGKLSVAYDDGPERHNVKPAIDVTMETAADVVDDRLIGVVLTGMGKDGAAGLSAIAAAGGKTIAQDETTARVYGMPKAAAETGDLDMVLPDDRVAEGIVNAVEGWT